MHFNSDFFNDCPTFQQYARRDKTRQSLGKGLAVFADVAFRMGSMRVPKEEFMALSGMSERTVNYYGGVKGIAFIFRKAITEAKMRLTGEQVINLRKIGITAISFGYADALMIMKENPELAMRRTGWPAGGFVMMEAQEEGEEFLMFTSAAGIDELYTPAIADMTSNDWVRLN